MSWLRINNDNDASLINLDKISQIFLELDEIEYGQPAVIAYFDFDQSNSILLCIGSESKCKDYMSALMEFVGGKQIFAVGEHRCSCECGCQAMIREDFEFCDECSEAFHLQDYHEHLDELKKNAA